MVTKNRLFWLFAATAVLVIAPPCFGSYGERPPTKTTRVMAINVSAPQQLSFSFGTAVSYPAPTFGHHIHGPDGRGVLFQVEPGLAGGKLGVGYAAFGGMAGVSAKVVALRTWWNPWLAQSNTTYVGVETSIFLMGFRLALGPLYSVTSNDHGSRWAFLGGIGIGF